MTSPRYADQAGQPERLLLPYEVARMFRVDAKTVVRWAKAGKLPSIRTLGGHRRFPEAAILALLDQHREGGDAQ